MNILEFWFPNDGFNKFWFDKTKDDFISNNYKKRLEELEKNNIDFNELSNEDLLETIILLDQFSRSIYRNNKEKIICNDGKALKLALYFFEKRDFLCLKFNHLIFYLMPLRHTFQKKYYQQIIDILSMINVKEEDRKLYNKFYNATIKKFPT
tara:strand:+ start:220 stop:675 length:456 start_codon:yes stop_codon:yes gene_type:complete